MKFFAVNPHLAFIRETHRLVLSWTRFEAREVAAFTAVLTKPDLAGLRDTLRRQDETRWQNADGLLAAQGSAERLVLEFRDAGTDLGGELALAGDELERFRLGVQALAGA